MTQTALELDHEENLRYSARRAIHAGIFGPTAGPMKVTDYPPEGHEGIKGGKLRPPADTRDSGGDLSELIEAEESAMLRGKSLKELAISRGNTRFHEVHEDEEDEAGAGGAVGAGSGDGDAALAAEAGSPEAQPASGAEKAAARTPAKTPSAAAPAAGAEK
ncbi:unnamed protein product, partial [Prorocentrum cordatum]